MNSLMKEAVPSFFLFKFKGSVTISLPFFEQCPTTILFAKVSSQCILKTATKGHSRSGFLFPPAIEVTVTIAAGAAEILADLRVAIDHRNHPVRPAHRLHRLRRRRALPTRQRVRTSQDFGKNAHSKSCARYERPRAGLGELFHRPDRD